MPRYARNVAIMAKVETTAGVDAVPVAATDGLLITGKPDITPLEIKYAERDLLLPYFGGSQSLVAQVNAKMSFSVELAGSGTAGTAAAWSALLRGCAAAQTVLATPARVEHTPMTDALTSITIYVIDSGVQHRMTGSMGNCKITAKKGETPKLMFEFIGSYQALTAVAVPALNLGQWRPPHALNAGNVVDITLGCTYAAGVLSGGTKYGSNGLELDLGAKPVFFSTLSRESAEITDRQATCSFELELTAAQEVAAATDVRSNVTTGLGFTIGSAAGSKIIIFAPAVQRTAMKKVENDGVRMIGFDAKVIPVSGNDEWRLVQL